jgi:hypothetical protein
MFRLLGTPAADKRHVIEEGSHFVPRVRLIQEALAWLDRYQPLEAHRYSGIVPGRGSHDLPRLRGGIHPDEAGPPSAGV